MNGLSSKKAKYSLYYRKRPYGLVDHDRIRISELEKAYDTLEKLRLEPALVDSDSSPSD